MSGAPGPDFETVAWVYSQSELAVLLSLLAHKDIHVLPIARHNAGVDYALTTALGGVEIRVHAEEAEKVRQLLAGIDRTPFRSGIFSDNRWLDGIVMVILFVAGLFAPPARTPAHFVAPRTVAARSAD
ncbi:MAG TPA: hypothetical protein VEX35_04410 [Allosphingosinicella sp.]|nr:hypothetical protein [Allosphingosinicella sp.]